MTQDLKLRSAADLPLRSVTTVKELLFNKMAQQQLQVVAAKHMNPERMMRVFANAVRSTPKLGECDPLTLLGSLMTCASLGLEPNTPLGHAYLIPFEKWGEKKPQVQVIIGYKGFIDMAYRSGKIASIHAGIHYSDDELWEYENGTSARLRHREGPQEGQKLHAYAIAHFKDGGHAYVVLPWHHILKIRNLSQGYKSAIKSGKKDTPWIMFEDAMAAKTAVRALAKYLPMSSDFQDFSDAIGLDEARSNFREFALNPSFGLPMPEDGEFIEAEEEAEEQSKPKPAEVTETTKETKQVREPAPVEKKREPRQAEQTKEAAPVEERQRAASSKPDIGKRVRDAAAMIEVDLDDGMKPSDVRREYVGRLEEMKSFDPDLFTKTEDLIASYENRPKGDQFSFDQRLEDHPFAATFLDDVDQMGVDNAADFHATAIEAMREKTPDLFEAMMERARENETQSEE